MNTYNWEIQWMNTSTQPINGYNEVVLTVGWQCIGTYGIYTANVYNTASFVPPKAGDANFTPYADLTQDQVLAWIWADGVNKEATQEALDSMLANLANPPVIQPPLPWAK